MNLFNDFEYETMLRTSWVMGSVIDELSSKPENKKIIERLIQKHTEQCSHFTVTSLAIAFKAQCHELDKNNPKHTIQRCNLNHKNRDADCN